MGADQAFSFMNRMLWDAMIIALPILITTLLIGLVISVFQVATQIQEITLSYVPKIIAAALLLILLGPWMIGKVGELATALYRTIPMLAG
jgi:flagellar biosynthesis protein FliQ